MVQLIKLFKRRTLVKLFSLFLENPTTEFSFTSLKKKTNLAKATLSQHLILLSKNNFINVRKIGTTKLYQLLKEDIINKHFKILNNLFNLQPIKKIAKKFESEIYIYGSAARGEDTEKSDIDLLVIGEVEEEKLIKEIKSVLSKIKKEIKIQIFSPLEWSEMEIKDKAFYERVEKDKIKIS